MHLRMVRFAHRLHNSLPIGATSGGRLTFRGPQTVLIFA